jgi:hypothetical protein
MLKNGNKSMAQDCGFDDPEGFGTGNIPLAINGFWNSKPVLLNGKGGKSALDSCLGVERVWLP